jgi:hypothetical protein
VKIARAGFRVGAHEFAAVLDVEADRPMSGVVHAGIRREEEAAGALRGRQRREIAVGRAVRLAPEKPHGVAPQVDLADGVAGAFQADRSTGRRSCKDFRRAEAEGEKSERKRQTCTSGRHAHASRFPVQLNRKAI